jgi:hypothetical protein
MEASQQDAFIASLSPGGALDLRGTTITGDLLDRVLSRFHDPTLQAKKFGAIDFEAVKIAGRANFGGSRFTDDAIFYLAEFREAAEFADATFLKYATFEAATFTRDAFFGRAKFADEAYFQGVEFREVAGFGNAKFEGRTYFNNCIFRKNAFFSHATFSGPLEFAEALGDRSFDFGNAHFGVTPALGPLVSADKIDLSFASFDHPVIMEMAARQIDGRRVNWRSTAILRIRYAEIDLSDAFFEYPVAVTRRAEQFQGEYGAAVPEVYFDDVSPSVRLVSVRGVNAAHLLLIDLDLSSCLFSGAFHLDQIRMEGDCLFSVTPGGLQRIGLRLLRWTPRQTVLEEHHWRARGRVIDDETWHGWTGNPPGTVIPSATALSATYRQLRKSLEDSKNEPDAADFYYGEMEMRRHDPSRSRGERVLLSLYWATSGYGLRASRALGWLLTAMISTCTFLILWGIPNDSNDFTSTGKISGDNITITTRKPDRSELTNAYSDRLTAERLEDALQVTLNSVVFRSSGQDLTTAGSYIEMASRFSEPVLLGLAVLAIRGRVKR